MGGWDLNSRGLCLKHQEVSIKLQDYQLIPIYPPPTRGTLQSIIKSQENQQPTDLPVANNSNKVINPSSELSSTLNN